MLSTRETVNCPACYSVSSSEYLAPIRDHISLEDFSIHRCQACETVYLKDQPVNLVPYYENDMGSSMHRSPGFFAKLRHVLLGRELQPLLEKLNPGDRIVDIGAGDGNVAQYLRDRGYKAEALDFFPASNWHRPDIPYESVDLNDRASLVRGLRQLSPDAPPKAVFMRHVFEHVKKPREILETLKEAGIEYVLIIVPCIDSRLRHVLGKSWAFWDPPRHLNFFSRETLNHVIAQSGYQTGPGFNHGIDEIFTTFYRYAHLRSMRFSSSAAFFGTKGILTSVSSALSYPVGRSVRVQIGCLK